MKIIYWMLTLTAAVVTAQSSSAALYEALPDCAATCAIPLITKSPCSSTDIFCLCDDASFVASLTQCVGGQCSVRDSLATANLTSFACHQPVRNESYVIKNLAPAMAAVSLAFVIIRLIARSNMLGWDDGLIVAAWAFGVAVSILNMLMAFHGLGQDIWTNSIHNTETMLKLFYVTEPLYLGATILTKIALCLFLLRIFPFRGFQITMWILIGICVAAFVSFALALILQCSPIEYSWLFFLNEMEGKCLDRNAGTWAHACVNIALDLIILAVPVIQLWTMQTSYSIRKKIQVMIMFSIGIVVTVCSVLRLRYLIVFMSSHNPTWDNLGCAEWSIVEIQVGIICACLPSARIFFGRMVPKLLGVTSQESRAARSAQVCVNTVNSRRPPHSWNRITMDDERQLEIKSTRDFVILEEVGMPETPESSTKGSVKAHQFPL